MTKAALAQRLFTVQRLVLNLFLLDDACSAALAHDLQELTLIKLMRAKQQLLVSQLVVTASVVTLESHQAQRLQLNLVQMAHFPKPTLAGRLEELAGFTLLPPLETRVANILLAFVALRALHHDLVAKHTLQRVRQVLLVQLRVGFQKAFCRYAALEREGRKLQDILRCNHCLRRGVYRRGRGPWGRRHRILNWHHTDCLLLFSVHGR